MSKEFVPKHFCERKALCFVSEMMKHMEAAKIVMKLSTFEMAVYCGYMAGWAGACRSLKASDQFKEALEHLERDVV